MLPRTLEPEVMDTPEDAAVYDEMDHQAVNLLFVDDLLAFCSSIGAKISADETEGELIDLGTGTARIPIELCRRLTQLRVVATDYSISMLDIARVNLEIAGMMDRIMLDRVDAKQSEYPDARFDGIISNSLIHHLAEPMGCLEEATRIVRPDGFLFIRDLMRPDSAEEVDRLVTLYAAEAPPRARQLFRESLHAALTLSEIQDIVSNLGCDPQSVRASSDRHWTWAAQMPPRTPDSPGISHV